MQLDVSPHTVHRWVREYTRVAIGLMSERPLVTGGNWHLLGIQFRSGSRIWWMIFDDDTACIVASHVNRDDMLNGIRTVIRTGVSSTVCDCRVITLGEVSDSRGKGVLLIDQEEFSEIAAQEIPEATVLTNPAFRTPPALSTTTFLPWLQESQRLNRIQGLADLQLYTTGWAITRNLMVKRNGTSLLPFTDWSDVVRKEGQRQVRGFYRCPAGPIGTPLERLKN